MTRPTRVPELKNPARIHLALDIAAYMTEQACNLRGIEIAAPARARTAGPKDWAPQGWPSDIRQTAAAKRVFRDFYSHGYTAAAQRVFNDFYSQARGIIESVFGPDPRPRLANDLPEFPKLPNGVRVELASEIAGAMTELEAAELGITLQVQSGVGPKDWDPGHRKAVAVSYTEQAQDIFNDFYGTAHTIVDGHFGDF